MANLTESHILKIYRLKTGKLPFSSMQYMKCINFNVFPNISKLKYVFVYILAPFGQDVQGSCARVGSKYRQVFTGETDPF